MERKECATQIALGTLPIKEWMIKIGCGYNDGLWIEPAGQYAASEMTVDIMIKETKEMMPNASTRDKAMAIISLIQQYRIPIERCV